MLNFLAVSTTGISKDDFIDNVAKEILTKIPPEFDINKVKKNFGVAVTPTAIVLFQELARFNKLIGTMTRTLNQLRKVKRDKLFLTVLISLSSYTIILNSSKLIT